MSQTLLCFNSKLVELLFNRTICNQTTHILHRQLIEVHKTRIIDHRYAEQRLQRIKKKHQNVKHVLVKYLLPLARNEKVITCQSTESKLTVFAKISKCNSVVSISIIISNVAGLTLHSLDSLLYKLKLLNLTIIKSKMN